jgi:hypothetical protein
MSFSIFIAALVAENPPPPMLLGLQSWLASQPRQRAQAIMRVLTGAMLQIPLFAFA